MLGFMDGDLEAPEAKVVSWSYDACPVRHDATHRQQPASVARAVRRGTREAQYGGHIHHVVKVSVADEHEVAALDVLRDERLVRLGASEPQVMPRRALEEGIDQKH